MEQNATNPIPKEDEISLKDLIIKTRNWIAYLLGKWKIIVPVGLLGGALGFTYAYFQEPNYQAELTFVLEDSKSNPLGAYAGIASQFGIDLGAGSSSGVFTGDNIIEFLKSRLMIEKTLLSPVTINGKEQSIAELYITSEKLRKAYNQKPALKDIQFPVQADRKKFSLLQDSILSDLHKRILKKNLSVARPDKKLSFISVKCLSPSDVFSKVFTERLVVEATDFYIETKTKRSKKNVDKLQAKADSIETLLNQKTYSAAYAQDLNQNPVKRVATVGLEMANRDKMVLQTMYGEVVKNLELSKMTMAQETPLIQIVDTPSLPLEKKKFGKLKGLIIGGFLAGFLILIWLIVKRIYRDVMK